MPLRCPTCRTRYDDGLTYCPRDGAQLAHVPEPVAPAAPPPAPAAAAPASSLSGAVVGALVGLVVVLGGALAVLLTQDDGPEAVGPPVVVQSEPLGHGGGVAADDAGVQAAGVQAAVQEPVRPAPLPDRAVTVQRPPQMTGPAEVVSNNEGLFLRSGPGTGYAVLGKMLPGDIVTSYGCDTVADGVRWCNVLYGGTSGYASREFLDVGGPSRDSESGLEQAFAASDRVGAYASIDTGEASFVNVRLRPFVGSPVLGKMRPGASIEVVRCLPYGWSLGGAAIEGRWCFVNWAGRSGAVSGWASDGALRW